MKRTLALSVLAAAFTLSACGDSGGPSSLSLTEAQAEDMMEALSMVGSSTGFSRQTALFRQGPTAELLTINLDETDPCPNGGTHRVQGSITVNDASTQVTANITQGYTGCKSTSPNGVLWTFDGSPNIVFQYTMTMNESTGAFNFSGTQKGAIKAASTLGNGQCAIDLNFSGSGNANTGSVTSTATGTVCGRTVNVTVTE